MFTGIIETLGRIKSIDSAGGDSRMRFEAAAFFRGANLGDSIAVNGVCLTAVELGADYFCADLSAETLKLTTAGSWQKGSAVNLERALTAGKELGGHFVAGHVDGVGTLIRRSEDARSLRMEFEAPAALARYIARKGSICIDGISLTVNEVQSVDAHTPPPAPQTVPPSPAQRERDSGQRPVAAGVRFGVNIIPHTLQQTTLGALKAGSAVNLEVDLVARYLERLLEERNRA